MATHDPRQITEQLRNHLATHDRRLVFLFGAGTSCAINVAPMPAPGEKPRYQPLIPGVADLTDACGEAVAALGDDQANAWRRLKEQCEAEGRTGNVENILSKVRTKIDAVGSDETLVGLDRDGLVGVERTICGTIATSVNPDEATIPDSTPHDGLASWVRKATRTVPLEVFTTNYDVLIERALEASRLPVFDGFVGTHRPFFLSDCLEDENELPGPKWVRLWKLHGSVNWVVEEGVRGARIVRSGASESGEMILPSHRKYDESRKQPYIAFMDRLSRMLNNDHALLITCGYSFGDEHINAIIFGALDNRISTNVVALQYDELDEDGTLSRNAKRRANLTVIGPNGGVISGQWGEWKLTLPVDVKTASFMDNAFDSNAMPEPTPVGSVPTDLRGRMRLGDFNWFCRFLEAMEGHH